MNYQPRRAGGRGFFTVIVRAWALIVGVAIAAGFAALAYCWITKPVYQATATLYVTSGTPTTASSWDGVKASQDRMATYAQLVYTDVVLSPALKTAGLDMSAQQAKSAINVVIDPLITTMIISATDHDPLVAQRLADAVSDSLAQAVSTLEVPSTGGTPVAKLTVVDSANVDPDPVSPKPLMAVAFAVFVGLIAGALLALARERLNNRVRDEMDAEEALGTRTLATIPDYESKPSEFTASLRLLRTVLTASTPGSAVKCLMVTSAQPKEGKTTAALNMAKALAHANYSVVVVDADLKNPELSRKTQVAVERGLTDVLCGRATLDAVLSQTGSRHLALLGAGSMTSSADLLSPKEFGKLLTELANRFEYVIIDSAVFLDSMDVAVSVALAAGGVLIVTRRRSRLSDLRRVRERLEDLKVNVAGMVLCDFSKHRSRKKPKRSSQPNPSLGEQRRPAQEPRRPAEQPVSAGPVPTAWRSSGTAAALKVKSHPVQEQSSVRVRGSHRA